MVVSPAVPIFVLAAPDTDLDEIAEAKEVERKVRAAADFELQQVSAKANQQLQEELRAAECARVASVQAAINRERSAIKAANAMETREKELAHSAQEREHAGYKAEAMRSVATTAAKEACQSAKAKAEKASQAARARADAAKAEAMQKAEAAKKDVGEATARRMEAHTTQKRLREESRRREAAEQELAELEAAARRPIPLRVVGAVSGENVCTLPCERHWTVRQLKKALQAVEGTPVAQQRLLVDGRILRDEQCLRESLEEGLSEVWLARLDQEWAALIENVGDGLVTLDELDEMLRCDRDIVMAAVKERGWELAHAAESVRADKEVVLAAVRKHGDALQFASETLQRDKVVVLAAARSSYKGSAVKYAVPELFENPAFLLSLLEVNADLLQHASEEILRSRQFVLEAVEINGLALEHVDVAFREDVQVVYLSTISHSKAFEFAAPHFRRNMNVSRQLSAYQCSYSDLHRARFRSALMEAATVHQKCQEPD